MKFLEDAMEINADEEIFQYGYKIQISKLEFTLLEYALKRVSNDDDNELINEHKNLLKKLQLIPHFSEKGFTQVKFDDY